MIGRSGRTLALALSGVLALSGAVGAQEAPAGTVDPADEELTLSAPISVLVAEQLGNDPEAIFRFVADHVRYEPYSGLLRGAAGTYFGRAGNSVDQSLLLARVLEGVGVDTRLAVGSIGDDVAAQLLDATVLDAQALEEHRTMAWSGQLPGYEEAPEVPSIATYLPAYDGDTQTEMVDDWLLQRTGETLGLIDDTLAEAGISLPAGYATLPASERNAHVWLQADIGGEWVDLDPSLPGLAFGEALTQADETLTDLPLERTHVIELAIVAETLEDGALVEERLMEAALPAWEVAGEPIVIAHVGPDADPALSQRFEAVLGITSRHPVLVVGDGAEAGTAIQFGEPGADGGGGLGGGFFDASSSLPEVTAEWIEATIKSPDADPVTIRRAIFDRVPADARANEAVSVDDLASTAEVDIDGDGTPELPPDLTVTWLTVATGHPSPLSGVLELAEEDERLLSIVPWTQQMVTHLAEGGPIQPLGIDAFVDAPNLTAVSGTVSKADGGELAGETSIDVWHRSHGVLPVAGTAPPAVPAALPGILAQASEQLVAGEVLDTSAADHSVTVSKVLDAAAELGTPITAITGAEAVDGLPYSELAKSTLRRALADGWVAVAPASPVEVQGQERVGWWLVDPERGRVVDQMDDGRGVNLFEYEKSNIEVVGLTILGVVGGIYAIYKLWQLIVDPPQMQQPGQGFRAVQQFFGFGR
jgi:hypothetical protein